MSVEMKKARQQKEAWEAIKQSGGFVYFDYEDQQRGNPPPGAVATVMPWLRELLGEHFFATAFRVDTNHSTVTDACLERLTGLTQLKTIQLRDTQVTDAGLEHLKGLTQLQWLSLGRTEVTDEGLADLQEVLPKCKVSHGM
jgi:hypothetical protein